MPRGIPKKKKVEKKKKEEKEFEPPFSESEPEVDEETSVEEKNDAKGGNCKGCEHPDASHYGTKDRWCNENNCRCQAYLK